MRDFLDDDTPLWERLGYASEADYHEAQARRAREAKEQQAREAAQRHAAVGRDYDLMKRINRRIKRRKYNRDYSQIYYQSPANRRKRVEATQRWRARHPEWVRAYQHDYYRRNWRWIRRYNQVYRAENRERLAQYSHDYDVAMRSQRNGYMSQSDRSAQSEAFAQQVYALRQSGAKWTAISEMLGRPMSSCVHAYNRAIGHRPPSSTREYKKAHPAKGLAGRAWYAEKLAQQQRQDGSA